MRRHPWIAVLLGVIVSAVLLLFAARGVDGAAVKTTLATANYWLVAPFLLVLFLYYWVKTVRWTDLLSPVARSRASQLFPSVMIGYAGSALLPLQLGELIRAWLAARGLSIPALAVLMSIALERIFDLLSIVLLLGIALALGKSVPPLLISAGWLIAAGSLAAAGMILFYVHRTPTVVRWTRSLTRWLPEKLSERIVRQVEAGAGGLQALRDGRLLLRALATSVLQWLFMWACVWISLAAVGIEPTVLSTFVVLVLMIIGISLPNSPGYVGSIQLAYVLALKPLGVDPAIAIGASVFFHVLAYVSVVVAGLFFLQRVGVGVSGLRAAFDQRV